MRDGKLHTADSAIKKMRDAASELQNTVAPQQSVDAPQDTEKKRGSVPQHSEDASHDKEKKKGAVKRKSLTKKIKSKFSTKKT